MKSEIEKIRLRNFNLSGFLAKLVFGIIDSSKSVRNRLIFSVSNTFASISHIMSSEKILCYLELVSKTTKELGLMQYKSPYNKGDLVYKLCPLERYPVVKLDKDKYIVPNFRYYTFSFTNIIHFIFQDLFPNNEFNETFGTVYEYYIRNLLEERMPNVVLIPEIRYKKSNDGPDVTIIDKENKALYAIEIKAKNVKLDTKLSPISELFMEDLERVFKALEKLPQKIEDLYTGLPEYAEWQSDIDSIDKENVYCLVVIGQGIYFMAEIINMLKTEKPDHFLNSYPHKYGVMALDVFETAVELAYNKESSFNKLLNLFWQDSITADPKNNAAEHFGGLTSESKDAYLKKYTDLLFKDFYEYENNS